MKKIVNKHWHLPIIVGVLFALAAGFKILFTNYLWVPIAASKHISCAPINDTWLAAYWKFDEGSGKTAKDNSGHGHVGTLESVSWSTTAAPAIVPNLSALYFSGSIQERVTFAKSEDLQFGTQSFSISVFVQPEPGTPGSVMGTTKDGKTADYGLHVESRGVAFFVYGEDVQPSHNIDIFKPGSVFDGNWHHVAGVFTRTGQRLTLKTYLDGSLIGIDSAAVGNISSGDALMLGNFYGEERYKGYIDEVRIYARPLSAHEIRSLAAGCRPKA